MTSTTVGDVSPEQKRVMLAQLLRDKIRTARVYPLSFAQERLWLFNELQPGLSVHNVPVPLRWAGPLNVPALERALNEIMRRHEVLRTTFDVRDGQPVQVVAPAYPMALPLIDLRSMPANTREAEAQRLAAQEAGEIFDLTKGPLFHCSLIRLDDADHMLLVNMHHIVSDGWSIGIMIREMNVLYAAYASGRPSPLTDLPMQYADFAQWQRQYLTGDVLQSHLSYWKRQLEGAPAVLELPMARLRPAIQTFRGAWQSFLIDPGVGGRLKQLSRNERATLFMTFLAAFKTLLHRYTGQDDLVVGTPIANRNRGEIEGLIGFFVNTLVLRSNAAGNPSFREFLRRVREVTFGAYAHQDLPFERLVEEMRPERNLSHNPLFQVMFVVQNAPTMPQATTKPSPEEQDPDTGETSPGAPQIPVMGTSKFDLTMFVEETAEGLKGTVEYNTDLFEHETVTRMIGHFQTLLGGIAANPEQRLSDFSLLADSERDQLLSQWNDTETSFPAETCFPALFEEQVRRTPNAVAVSFAGRQIAYDELNGRANQLAHYLRKLGVGPEVRVAICMERSPDMVIGVLAILKAGGAYVPLDPSFPAQRLAVILEDAETPILLTQESVASSLPDCGTAIVRVDAEWETIARESREDPPNAATPDNVLALFYTSGSTGVPKGTLEHGRGFVNLLHWYRAECALGEGSRVLLMTSFTFDAWFKNAMTPLIAGATLVVPDADLYDVERMLEVIEGQNVTMLFSTPSLLYSLLDLAQEKDFKPLATLESIGFGGEATNVAKLRPWLNSSYCKCRLLHIYGPSECSDVTSVSRPTAAEINTASHLTIGNPIDNVRIFVLDKHLSLQPVGVPGELYIAGVGVARGYLKRPELTAEKFVPNPFGGGDRLYRTGDLVRRLSNGDVEFLGRADNQVKIRGIRIELEEIESVLTEHPLVKDTVVMVRDDDPAGHKRLEGFVVPKQQQAVAPSDLRRHLKARLPEYMVPAAITLLERLPISANGKVDRQALAALDTGAPKQDEEFVTPHTPVQEVLAGIWAEVLNLPRVGVHDNFFELGGHSLLATQVISRIRAVFRLDLPVRSIFEAPTVAELAEEILQDPDRREAIEKTAMVLLRVMKLSDNEVDALLSGQSEAGSGAEKGSSQPSVAS